MIHLAEPGGTLAVAVILAGGGLALVGLWLALAGRRWLPGGVAIGAGLILALMALLPRAAVPPPEREAAVAPEPVGIGVELVISDEGLRTTRAPLADRGDGAAEMVAVGTEEREPNDALIEANLIALDAQVAGQLVPGDHDNFAVDLPAGSHGQIVATMAVTIGSVSLTLYDEVGQPVATGATVQELSVRDTIAEHRIVGSRFYLLVQALDGPPTAYRVHVTVRP